MQRAIVIGLLAFALLVVALFTELTTSKGSTGLGGGKGVAHTAPPPHRGAQLIHG
jgi:hypothetical protein